MLDTAFDLNMSVDIRRQEANLKLDPQCKSAQGQFMTPPGIARFMASLFADQHIGKIRLLDAGAGVGSLTAAFVDEFCERQHASAGIEATVYETDPVLASYLEHTLGECAHVCHRAGIAFASELIEQDFIAAGAEQLFMGLLSSEPFTHAILNPPYKKISTDSDYRRQLRSLGIETVNLYTGFLGVAIKMLAAGGEMVAIVPRSFCNGPYYRPFRELLLEEMALKAIHVFESRTKAFKDDEVLQENVIFYAVKGKPQGMVCVSSSQDADFEGLTTRTVAFSQMVNPSDPERFIHITPNDADQRYVDGMASLPCTLKDLGIDASTGPVVDFRLREYLRSEPESETYPLIYPVHCRDSFVRWPVLESKKPNAITNDTPVLRWLYPNGYYVVVRRFSSKEERRRVVAAIHEPNVVPGERIGFENHLNVFHRNRQGLNRDLAYGLAVYLNSTLYDICFRQFNGHTQVNVKDVYTLRYPNVETLEAWGMFVSDGDFPDQDTIDAWVEETCFQ